MYTEEPSSPSARPPKQVIERYDVVDVSTAKTASGLGAVKMQRVIAAWPSKSEVWPLLYTPHYCAILAGATGFYITYQIRSYMYMLHAGRLTMYIATCVFPIAAAGLGHYMAITNNILERQSKCPICVQVKAGLLQFAAGVLYPTLIAPVVAFPILSKMKKSFTMPNLVTHPKEVFKFFTQIYKPFSKHLLPIAAVHTITVMGLTYFQQDAYITNVVPILQTLFENH